MKLFPALIFIAIILAAAYSCKKDSDNSPALHRLTYKVTSNNYQPLSNILYNDSTNKFVQASAVDSSNGWTKTMTVTTSFIALIEVQGLNNSPDTLKYTLEIDKDNMTIATQAESVNSFSSFDTQITATVE